MLISSLSLLNLKKNDIMSVKYIMSVHTFSCGHLRGGEGEYNHAQFLLEQ